MSSEVTVLVRVRGIRQEGGEMGEDGWRSIYKVKPTDLLKG